MAFQEDAPVQLRIQLDTEAEPERVWSVLAGVEGWPAWHRRIAFARLQGELVEGSRLQWACDGMRFSSVLTEVESPARLAWTLRTFGARGHLGWTLSGREGGGTRIELEESWEGWLVSILRRTVRRTLVPSRSEWLENLADRCEAPEVP